MTSSINVLFSKDAIATVSQKETEELKRIALESPLKRSRLCLHHTQDDPVQEMVIALHRDTYLRPHRHQGKSESFHMIEGAVCIAFFDDAGAILQTVRLFADLQKTFLYRLSESLWHTVIPLTEFAVFQEVTTGPFSSSEYPAWEPENTPEAQEAFKTRILRYG